MGDVGDTFNALKEHRKYTKRKRLQMADDTGWNKYTEFHWWRRTSKGKLDYWPSTGTCMLNGKRYNIKSRWVTDLLAETEKQP